MIVQKISDKSNKELEEGIELMNAGIESVVNLIDTLKSNEELYPLAISLMDVTIGLKVFTEEVIRLRGIIDENNL